MNDIFDDIVERVTDIFSHYVVRVEPVPDSPATRQIAVYGVRLIDREAVRDLIHKLDWELCQPAECAALARVVDETTTKLYYPEFWAGQIRSTNDFVRRVNVDEWEPSRHKLIMIAANVELALAA